MPKRMPGFAYVAARKTGRESYFIIPSARTTAAASRQTICDKSKWPGLRKAGYRIVRVKLTETAPSSLSGDERNG